MSALSEFWEYVRDFRSLLGWMVKCAFTAPLVPILLNLGPPWDAGSPEAAKGAVAVLTAVAQMFALTAAFAFGASWTADKVKVVLRRSLCWGVVSLVVYLGSLVFLTEMPRFVSQRYVTGFVRTDGYLSVLAEFLGDSEKAKDALGRDPLKIWEPWTVYLDYFAVNLTWLAFFGSLTFYMGAFIKGLPSVQEEAMSAQNRRSIYELGLSAALRQELEAAGIVTVGDLASKTERELMEIPKIGEAKIESIRLRMKEHGRCLRNESLEPSGKD